MVAFVSNCCADLVEVAQMNNHRDDDLQGPGYCPQCGRMLAGLTTEARGFCEIHGWVFAEWHPAAERTLDNEDDEILKEEGNE